MEEVHRRLLTGGYCRLQMPDSVRRCAIARRATLRSRLEPLAEYLLYRLGVAPCEDQQAALDGLIRVERTLQQGPQDRVMGQHDRLAGKRPITRS